MFTKKNWEISIGLYPGILFGSRMYEAEDFTTYVIYLPFVDVAIIVEN